ncbi:MAG: hypothetical protein M3332_12310 [Actinomycetota bacterium]|nr:hypothetical protein [Actinomycetota bacterium]
MTKPRVYDDDRLDEVDQSMFALTEDDDPEQYMTDEEVPDGLQTRS